MSKVLVAEFVTRHRFAEEMYTAPDDQVRHADLQHAFARLAQSIQTMVGIDVKSLRFTVEDSP